MSKPAWTQEQREWAVRLSLSGKSAAQIAVAYNEEFPDFPPKTRNAVTGLLDRIRHGSGKLTKVFASKPRRPRAVPAKVPQVAPAKISKISLAKPQRTAVTLVSPEILPEGAPGTLWGEWRIGTCRMPVFGNKVDKNEHLFCGEPVKRDEGGKGNYCAACAARAYRQPEDAERRRQAAEAFVNRAGMRTKHQRLTALRHTTGEFA